MKEPKIRFKGFRGEWEEKALGCCVAFLDSMRKPIEEVKRTKGIYPYYGASGVVDYINNYIFDEELLLLSEDGANITDRNYPICFIARGKYWVNNHAHVLKANNGFDNVFLCNNLERKDYTKYNTGMAMPKLNKEVCIRIPVFFPTLPEQQSIASYFQHLDALIQSTTKKIESLKQVKAASLQSMFPQEGETTPRVRFKGFEGEWDVDIIGNICNITTGKSNTQDQVQDGKFPFFIRSEKIARSAKYLYNEEAIITIGDGNIGKVFHYIKGKFDLHQRCYMMYAFNNIIHAKYFYYYFAAHFYDRAIKMSAKATVDSVRLDMIANMGIIYPSFAEQRAIASYFTTLDRQITLHTQRLEKLKQIKAACLDKMFV